MSEQKKDGDKKAKVPTRPNSKWATGKRRTLDPTREKRGFARGALIK